MMKTVIFFIVVILCLVYIPVEANAVKRELAKEPIRFVKRAVTSKSAPAAAAPAQPAPPPANEDDDEKPKAGKEPEIVPDAKAKQDLRTMVESLVSLVNGLRQNGKIRLPDPMERNFKAIIEALEKLQDDLNTDLDIDMGNLLNSGGK